MFSKKIIKNISVALVSSILLSVATPSATALADTISDREFNYQMTILDNHQEDLDYLVNQMEAYSYYDGETVHIDHKIVDDGILTEKQYQATLEVDEIWQEFLEFQRNNKKESEGIRSKRALPALLILALKALGAIVGTAVVERITNDFMTWGLKEGCKAYKKYGPIKSFCKANGYI